MDDDHKLAIVKVLGCVLTKLCRKNSTLPNADKKVTKFHASCAPNITIQAYLDRIQQYASCSGECFILALIYIDRMIQRSNFIVTDLNVHRVIITSVTLAVKYFDDQYFNNAYYVYLQYFHELMNHATNEISICDHCFTPDIEIQQPVITSPIVMQRSIQQYTTSINANAIGDDGNNLHSPIQLRDGSENVNMIGNELGIKIPGPKIQQPTLPSEVTGSV